MATVNGTNPAVIMMGLITDEQYMIILESGSLVWVVLSLVGIVSNIININTFIVTGLGDSVTISFLALSVFDLAYVSVSLCLGVSVGFIIIELKSSTLYLIEPYGVFVFCGNILILLNVTNVLTTTFLAVARCMCVAKPLHFKNTFTREKTVIFIFGFTVFAVAIYTPVLANMGMVLRPSKKTNTSRLCLWISPRRESIKDVVLVLIDMVLPFATQFVIVTCVLIMTNKLRAASKFRQASMLNSSKSTSKQSDSDKPDDNSTKAYSKSPDMEASTRLTKKDLQVVQQVVLISVVYIVCNTPKMFISLYGAIEPQFTIGGRLNNVYISVNGLRKHFEIFNASVNTLIYYKYNTKFRSKMCL